MGNRSPLRVAVQLERPAQGTEQRDDTAPARPDSRSRRTTSPARSGLTAPRCALCGSGSALAEMPPSGLPTEASGACCCNLERGGLDLRSEPLVPALRVALERPLGHHP